MFKYVVVSTDSGEFKLSANLDKHDKFYMPSLTTGNGDSCQGLFSDNESYLIDEVYAYLQGDIDNEEFDIIFKGEQQDLLSVFNEAIDIGFFDEYFDKNN